MQNIIHTKLYTHFNNNNNFNCYTEMKPLISILILVSIIVSFVQVYNSEFFFRFYYIVLPWYQ